MGASGRGDQTAGGTMKHYALGRLKTGEMNKTEKAYAEPRRKTRTSTHC